MEWGAVLAVLGVTALVAVFLARPVLEERTAEVPPGERRLSVLRGEQDRLLTLIRDLDSDHLTGKISPEDHGAQRQPLVLRAANVMREIDELPPASGEDRMSLDEAIEAAVRELRAPAPEGARCAVCGAPIGAEDRTCSRCGAAGTRGGAGP